VHHVGILYDQFMMHGQRNIKLRFIVGNYTALNKSYIVRRSVFINHFRKGRQCRYRFTNSRVSCIVVTDCKKLYVCDEQILITYKSFLKIVHLS